MHVQGNSFWKSLLIDGAKKLSQRFADHLEHRLYLEVELSRDPGLQVIHIPDLSMHSGSDLQLLKHLLDEYKVLVGLRFSLLTRLRFAIAFLYLDTRQQYNCIHLLALLC